MLPGRAGRNRDAPTKVRAVGARRTAPGRGGHAGGGTPCNSIGKTVARANGDLRLGGIDQLNFESVLDAGAAGIAAIRAFGDEASLREMTNLLK